MTTRQADTVLFVSFSPYLGGAQMSLLTILGALPDGIKAVLACPREGPLPGQALEKSPSVEILGLPIRSTTENRWSMRLRWALTLAKWIRSNRSRLVAVHANGDAELKLVVPSVLLMRPPVVVWFHSKILSPSTVRLSPLWRLLQRRILWAPVSTWLMGEGRRHGLFIENNSLVIPNPIDPADVLAPARDRLSSWPVTIGYLGGEFEDKGILTVASVAEQMREDPVRFHVVTKGWDRNRNSAKVNDALDRLRALPDTVEMRPRSYGPALYADMDVLFVPSQAESFCRVAAEAMINGMPVAASWLPALVEVVGDGEAGLLFPVDDAAEAARLLRRLADDPILRQALGDEGRRRAERYLPNRVMDELMAAYRLRLPLRKAQEDVQRREASRVS